METVLVTGINGFVGTRVASVLMESGFRVRGSVRRRPTFCCRDEIDIVQVGNLEDCPDWSIALDGVSVVVHLAARVHIMKDTAIDPIEEYRKANVEGTVALAEQSAMHGVRRFVFVSSIKAMGEERDTAYMESDVPAPVDPYGISKLEAEEALRDIGGNTGMEVVILRPPLIYGPHVKGNFYQLMEFANKGIPIPLGSVKNRRSFIYVGNFADAIATCIRHPKAAGSIYLVSDGQDLSTAELVKHLYMEFGKPRRVFGFPSQLMEIAGKLLGQSASINKLFGNLTVDISKITRELSWTPLYTVSEGIADATTWFDEVSRSRLRKD